MDEIFPTSISHLLQLTLPTLGLLPSEDEQARISNNLAQVQSALAAMCPDFGLLSGQVQVVKDIVTSAVCEEPVVTDDDSHDAVKSLLASARLRRFSPSQYPVKTTVDLPNGSGKTAAVLASALVTVQLQLHRRNDFTRAVFTDYYQIPVNALLVICSPVSVHTWHEAVTALQRSDLTFSLQIEVNPTAPLSFPYVTKYSSHLAVIIVSSELATPEYIQALRRVVCAPLLKLSKNSTLDPSISLSQVQHFLKHGTVPLVQKGTAMSRHPHDDAREYIEAFRQALSIRRTWTFMTVAVDDAHLSEHRVFCECASKWAFHQVLALGANLGAGFGTTLRPSALSAHFPMLARGAGRGNAAKLMVAIAAAQAAEDSLCAYLHEHVENTRLEKRLREEGSTESVSFCMAAEVVSTALTRAPGRAVLAALPEYPQLELNLSLSLQKNFMGGDHDTLAPLRKLRRELVERSPVDVRELACELRLANLSVHSVLQCEQDRAFYTSACSMYRVIIERGSNSNRNSNSSSTTTNNSIMQFLKVYAPQQSASSPIKVLLSFLQNIAGKLRNPGGDKSLLLRTETCMLDCNLLCTHLRRAEDRITENGKYGSHSLPLFCARRLHTVRRMYQVLCGYDTESRRQQEWTCGLCSDTMPAGAQARAVLCCCLDRVCSQCVDRLAIEQQTKTLLLHESPEPGLESSEIYSRWNRAVRGHSCVAHVCASTVHPQSISVERLLPPESHVEVTHETWPPQVTSIVLIAIAARRMCELATAEFSGKRCRAVCVCATASIERAVHQSLMDLGGKNSFSAGYTLNRACTVSLLLNGTGCEHSTTTTVDLCVEFILQEKRTSKNANLDALITQDNPHIVMFVGKPFHHTVEDRMVSIGTGVRAMNNMAASFAKGVLHADTDNGKRAVIYCNP